MRYFIELSYNGTPFAGWQIQPQQTTVQGVIENALSHLLKRNTPITGCGRTDTGVHARQFFAHFESEEELSEETLQKTTAKLNNFLPKEIAIHRIFPVEDQLHARFSALSRTYKYYVATQKDVFQFHYAYRVFPRLDIEAMNAAAHILLHTCDFKSFSKVHTQVNNYRCCVTEAQWQVEDGLLVFTISADRFLRNMVRAVVGTLLEVGIGKCSMTDFQQVIDRQDRCAAGTSVPAHALFLHQVLYDFSSLKTQTP